jgi:hypothetical protein
MTHPITPPPELVEQWLREWNTLGVRHANPVKSTSYVAIEAAQWGADQELEACCETLKSWGSCIVPDLCSARRPKPPSAVAQAEALIERYEDGWCPSPAQWHVIREGLAEGRRALEALPND